MTPFRGFVHRFRGLAKTIRAELGLTCSESQARRWVQAWWEEIDAGTSADPIVAQVSAERSATQDRASA